VVGRSGRRGEKMSCEWSKRSGRRQLKRYTRKW
jgi:hypothetical protein